MLYIDAMFFIDQIQYSLSLIVRELQTWSSCNSIKFNALFLFLFFTEDSSLFGHQFSFRASFSPIHSTLSININDLF